MNTLETSGGFELAVQILLGVLGLVLVLSFLLGVIWLLACVVKAVRRRFLSTFLLEHIGALTRLGLPLAGALNFCTTRLSSASRRDVAHLEEAISEGGLLVGDAFARATSGGFAFAPAPRLVSPAEAETLRVGEMSGDLAGAVRLVLRERERHAGLVTWLVGAGFYAAGLLLIAAGVLAGLMTFIVPKFNKMFVELDVQLPLMTRMLMSVSDTLFFRWGMLTPLVAASLAAGVIVAFRLLRLRPILRGKSMTSLLQRVVYFPLWILRVFRRTILAEFCCDLAMLLRVGTPANRALGVIAEGTMNPWFRDRVRRAQVMCEAGVDLPTALDRAGLDRRASWFTRGAVGAQALADSIQRLADDYRTRSSWRIAVAVRLVPPLIVLCIGCCVGFVVISLFLPLVKLMSTLGS